MCQLLKVIIVEYDLLWHDNNKFQALSWSRSEYHIVYFPPQMNDCFYQIVKTSKKLSLPER